MDSKSTISLGDKYTQKFRYYAGNKTTEVVTSNKLASKDDIQRMIDIFSISPAYQILLDQCEDDRLFWNACEDIKQLFEEDIRSDVFYTLKIKKSYEYVPSKLVYVLTKAIEKYKFPNLALSMIPDDIMCEFTQERVLLGVTISDVLNNITRYDCKILSPYRKRALFGEVYEIYIESDVTGNPVDRIALLPAAISDCLSDAEISAIVFDPDKGLTVNGNPLRRLAGNMGITKSDFDLRGVI